MAYQGYKKGYDVSGPAIAAVPRRVMARANGLMTHTFEGKKTEMPMWIEDLSMGFGLAGSVGQSYRNRTFFPRNLNQVAVNLSLQFPNQEVYGEFCEFIRRTHVSLRSNVKLEVVPMFRGPKTPNNGHGAQRGPHSAISAEGYVANFIRRHERHEYAPIRPLSFVVEKMISPTQWRDDAPRMRKLESWHDIVRRMDKTFTQDPAPDSDQRPPNRPPAPIPTRPNAAGRQFGGAAQ